MFLLITHTDTDDTMLETKVQRFATLDQIAAIIGETRDDLSWSVRRTGRWDSEDGTMVVIPGRPEAE